MLWMAIKFSKHSILFKTSNVLHAISTQNQVLLKCASALVCHIAQAGAYANERADYMFGLDTTFHPQPFPVGGIMTGCCFG